MAKKTSVNLTTSDGTAFVLGASDVLLVLTEGTGSKVTYSRGGKERREISVAEAPADIVTAHGGLIEVTDASDGGGSTTFWINGDRVVSIEEAADDSARATIAIEKTQNAVAQVSTLTFDADLILGNDFDVDLGGVSMTTVSFDTDHDTTMDLIAAQIEAEFTYIDVTLTDATNNRQLTLTSNIAGRGFAIANEAVTGGLSQANVTDATTIANTKEIQKFTPANVEIGDEFYVSCSGDTVSFTATAATVANVTTGLSSAIDAAIGGSGDWSVFDYDTTNSTNNLTDVTVTGASGYTFTAATANTKSTIEYDNEGQMPTRYLVTDNVDELQVKLDAL